MDTILRYRDDNFTIRQATPADVPTIRELTRELADYESKLDQCPVTEAQIRAAMFKHKVVEAVIGEADGDAVAVAVFYTNYSGFTGKRGLFLEDLYVRPKARGNGYGKRIMRYLADQVVKRGYGRLEWTCMDWNSPSITFYHALGAESMDDKTFFRLSGDALENLAAE